MSHEFTECSKDQWMNLNIGNKKWIVCLMNYKMNSKIWMSLNLDHEKTIKQNERSNTCRKQIITEKNHHMKLIEIGMNERTPEQW